MIHLCGWLCQPLFPCFLGGTFKRHHFSVISSLGFFTTYGCIIFFSVVYVVHIFYHKKISNIMIISRQLNVIFVLFYFNFLISIKLSRILYWRSLSRLLVRGQRNIMNIIIRIHFFLHGANGFLQLHG